MRVARLFFLLLGGLMFSLLLVAFVLWWVEMDVRVVAPGTLEAGVAAWMMPERKGVIAEIYKDEGQMVAESEPVARLDDAAARERLGKARAAFNEARERQAALELERRRTEERIRIAELRLVELDAQRARAREQLDAAAALLLRRKAEVGEAAKAVEQALVRERQAERQLADYQRLLASRMVSERVVHDAESALELANLETERAQLRANALAAELSRTEAMCREAQIALDAITETNLKAGLDEARFDLAAIEARRQELEALAATLKADVRLAQLDLDSHLIRAPVAGRIEELFVYPGGPVGTDIRGQVHEAAGIIVQDDEHIFMASLAQQDIIKVRVGQAAEVALDAYPYRRYGMFRGEVVALKRLEQPETAYLMIIELARPIYPLRPGMRGFCRVIVGRVRVLSYLMGLVEDPEMEAMRRKADETGWATYPAPTE